MPANPFVKPALTLTHIFEPQETPGDICPQHANSMEMGNHGALDGLGIAALPSWRHRTPLLVVVCALGCVRALWMLQISLSLHLLSSVGVQDKYLGTTSIIMTNLSKLPQNHAPSKQHRAPGMIRVHTQPLICLQCADNDVIYFLVRVQVQIKLAPCNCLVQSLPLVRSSVLVPPTSMSVQ